MHLKLKNNLTEVQRLRLAVEDYGRALALSDKSLHRITLALEELITNTISYGYADASTRFINVTLSQQKQYLVIDIVDDAIAFDPRERHNDTLGGNLEERPIGGLGLHLLSSLSDEIHYRQLMPGNHTTLGFRI